MKYLSTLPCGCDAFAYPEDPDGPPVIIWGRGCLEIHGIGYASGWLVTNCQGGFHQISTIPEDVRCPEGHKVVCVHGYPNCCKNKSDKYTCGARVGSGQCGDKTADLMGRPKGCHCQGGWGCSACMDRYKDANRLLGMAARIALGIIEDSMANPRKEVAFLNARLESAKEYYREAEALSPSPHQDPDKPQE